MHESHWMDHLQTSNMERHSLTASHSTSPISFSLRISLLDWGILWHFKGHQPATRRAVGTGIPTGNIGDHLGKRTKRLGFTAQDNTIKQNPWGTSLFLAVMLGWGQRKDKWNLSNSRENESFAIWASEMRKFSWEQSTHSGIGKTDNRISQAEARGSQAAL